MKQEESKILNKLGKQSGFKTPDNYFNDFAKNLTANLPEIKVEEVKEKPNMWVRLRPYVYMAAMVAGIVGMIQVFNLMNGSTNGSSTMAGGQLGGTEIVVGNDGDTTVSTYHDSVRNEQMRIETVQP
ncbi:MAG: hypothetical protein Q4B68_06105 [Bacteroidales bacterium]|nr:hypothetical protein [Bacteroidales bacterium]